MGELEFIFWQESSCPGSKPDEYILYFMSMNRKCGIYKTERLKALNSFLNFTVSNTELPSNCSYNGIAEAINKFGSVNSTEFDVNKSPIEGKYIIDYNSNYNYIIASPIFLSYIE